MSIIDGQGLITWEGGLFAPGSDLLRRVKWAFGKIRAAGGTIYLNEAGRPFGVPGDANVGWEWQTASGRSTVWFQWGRYLRGETPSAADPRSGNVFASEHTQGIAIDCNAPTAADAALRAKYFAQAGLKNTISSESWHWAIRGNPLVDISIDTASDGATPLTNGDDELSAAEVADIKAHITAETNRLADYVRRESRLRLYKNSVTGKFMAASILTGRYEILSGQSEVDSLVQNGYLEIGNGDAVNPQIVDETRWANIIAKCPVNIKALAH